MAVGAVAGLVAAFAFGNTSSLDRTPAKGQPYKLYTQCGIGESRIGNRHFAAVRPLSDRAGDPVTLQNCFAALALGDPVVGASTMIVFHACSDDLPARYTDVRVVCVARPV